MNEVFKIIDEYKEKLEILIKDLNKEIREYKDVYFALKPKGKDFKEENVLNLMEKPLLGEKLTSMVIKTDVDEILKMLIDKKMNRTELHEQAHVSTNAIATMGKGGDVSTKVLDKICKTLDCQIHDIVDYVPDDDDVQEK